MHSIDLSTLRSRLSCELLLVLTLLSLNFGCSKSTDPDTKKPPDNGPVGILLSGSESDSALSGTTNHGPYAVPENEWDGDFVTTRLEAVINPSATVGTVNTALNGVGAKISCMRTGLMFTELVVPAFTSVAQADAVCSTLVASGAFLSVHPAFEPAANNGSSEFPDYPAKTLLGHLELAGFPASWNARQLLETQSSPATVLVVDDFLERVTHPEIPSQTFPAGAGIPNLGMDIVPGGTEWDGNHGFKVAGVIGAKLDSLGSTGAFPGRSTLLKLPCILTHGFGTWPAFLADIAAHLPLSGNFALNTSIGYPDTDFGVNSKLRRIEHALFWRALILGVQDRCLHATSAGNQGVASYDSSNAVYNSPFAMSAKFADPFAMLHGTNVSSQDTANLNAMFSAMTLADARMGAVTQNLLIVGASNWDGAPWVSSNSPSDVRMVGTDVVTTCAEADFSCSSGGGVPLQATASGTSFSTPQIAGLAAYLWGLSPSLTATEVKNLMLNSYNGKWVNAYQAVLALDHNLSNASVRLAILDVADINGQIGNNNKFDEEDLQMYIDSILFYEADRALNVPPWEKDHSVFDLNGDGYTGNLPGAESPAPFDLNINTPPSYSTVDVIPCDVPSSGDTTLSESAVTDKDILLYYAFSPLYQGDDSVRAELLGLSCSPFTFVRDSSHTWVSASIDPPVDVWENKESDGSSVTASVAESRDSIPSRCAEPASWTAMASGAFDITGSAIGTQYIVSGTVTLSGQAAASSDGYCSIPSRSRGQSGGFVDFVSNSNEFIPYTLSISGNVQPTNTDSGTWTECSISFYIVDSLGTVVGGVLGFNSSASGLPYEKSGVIGLLQPGQRLRLSVSAQENIVTSTVLNPLPPDAEVNIGFALTIGN